MTEEEWLKNETDHSEMHQFIVTRTTSRKMRLFSCACVRLVHKKIGDKSRPDMLNLVIEIEKFADGGLSKAGLRRAKKRMMQERQTLVDEDSQSSNWGAFWLTEVAASNNAFLAVLAEWNRLSDDLLITEPTEWLTVKALLRCIAGNPFRPLAFNPSWRTANTLGLAEAIYADRAFDRLPILADALEEAECDHPDVLAHCRDDCPHARGCWVVDLILGKV
jgi:hypothetical protein